MERRRRQNSSYAITKRSLRSSLRNNYDNTSVNTPLRYLHLWEGEFAAVMDYALQLPSSFVDVNYRDNRPGLFGPSSIQILVIPF